MPVKYDFQLVDVSSITVSEERQRKTLKHIEELADSIKRNGLLHPIVITRDNILVAGGRRFQAFQHLNLKKIPVHYLDELDEFEALVIELEENVRRRDLTWQENVTAIEKYHAARLAVDESWTFTKTGPQLGFTPEYIGQCVMLAKAIQNGNDRVRTAASLDAGRRIIRREMKRAVDTEVSKVGVVIADALGGSPTPKKKTKFKSEVFVGDFNDWAPAYDGEKFNFVHCDFPFGVRYEKTGYKGSDEWKKYDDSPDAYFKLLNTFCEHKDKFMLPSSHLMFWFSMNHYSDTVNMLDGFGFRVNPFPLIWHKDRGVIPDALRGPRRVYETAFFASLGDRQVLTSISNAHYSKVEKEGHLSTKPRAVLSHFFRMFVDSLSEVLDPTCGGGGALAVAKELGAKRVVGMDTDKDHAESAELTVRLATAKEDKDS